MSETIGDPGIPRGRPQHGPGGRKAYPMVGWFARLRTGALVLESYKGHTWPLQHVSICQGTWGSIDNSEGVTKLPRPREYDADGGTVVAGDRVMIDFLNGNYSTPIVRGGVRGVSANDFFPYTQDTTGADVNRLAMRLGPLDADGKPTGYVEFEGAHDGKASLRVSVLEAGANDKPGAPPAGARTYMSMDANEKLIQMANATGETLQLSPGQIALITSQGHLFMLNDDGVQWAQSDGDGSAEAYLTAKAGTVLMGCTEAIQMISKSIELGNGLVPPGDAYLKTGAFLPDFAKVCADLVTVAAAVPVVITDTPAVILDVTASLAAGPPYLSTVIKGQ